MSTYTKICYHIVFSTKNRTRVLTDERKSRLFRYMWGYLKNRDCHLFRINGGVDHVHILVDIPPKLSVASIVSGLKTSSNNWAKRTNLIPHFDGWQDGYAVFTEGVQDQDRLIEYIKQQREHHRHRSFEDELRQFLVESGIEFDERYLN